MISQDPNAFFAQSEVRWQFTAKECRQVSDALADVLCWFGGFKAAHAGKDLDLPPGLERLRDLNIRLKEAFPP